MERKEKVLRVDVVRAFYYNGELQPPETTIDLPERFAREMLSAHKVVVAVPRDTLHVPKKKEA